MVFLPHLQTRATCRYQNGYSYYYADCNSTWNNWARWVVLGVVIFLFFLIFFLFSCITARRRRRRGMQPFYGTGWVPGARPSAHQQQQPYGTAQPYYGNTTANTGYGAPAPPYSPPNQGYYYGEQQNGVELQAPQQSHMRAGDNVYEPPPGPPPGKKDHIVR